MNISKKALSGYIHLRTGKFFLIFLSLFCGLWIGWNEVPWLPQFDDSSFGKLTLILSVEASLATSMLIMSNQKQEEFQRKQLLYIQHVMEAQYDTIKIVRVYIENGGLHGHANPGGD